MLFVVLWLRLQRGQARRQYRAPALGIIPIWSWVRRPNPVVIRRVAETARANGREIAEPDDVRRMLNLPASA